MKMTEIFGGGFPCVEVAEICAWVSFVTIYRVAVILYCDE